MPIMLPKYDWWEVIGNCGLPEELVSMLRSLLSATLYNGIPPVADEKLIALAKKHLTSGLFFNDKLCDMMVYKPERPEAARSFFVLVRKWPFGELKRLSEL